jgi:predicted Zn finger-like uncharacterized protein
MEIQCPSCQKRLAIGDQYAGQLVKCPACNGVFMAPTLAKPPVAAPLAPTVVVPMPADPRSANATEGSPPNPPAPPPLSTATRPEILPFAGDPVERPELPAYPPPSSAAPPSIVPPPSVEPKPGPPGEFARTKTVPLRADVVRWIAPVCLALVFFLSFLPWWGAFNVVQQGEEIRVTTHRNLWEAAFGTPAMAGYILYLLLTLFVALPLAWVKLLMEMNLIPTPDVIRPVWPWRSAILLGILAFTLFFPLIDWLRSSLLSTNLTGLGMNLAIRLHEIALIASALEFWLAQRKKKRLPTPEATLRW